MSTTIDRRLQLDFDFDHRRRWIAGQEMILHCHHYNSRIQRTIEGATAIDGKLIFSSTAEAVFFNLFQQQLGERESLAEKAEFCSSLYAHLGYGKLNLGSLKHGVVTAPSSHYVEGWHAGLSECHGAVCSLTQGYLQAVYASLYGETVYFDEVACQACGADQCRFEMRTNRKEPISSYEKNSVDLAGLPDVSDRMESPRVDEDTIVSALAEMPIEGGNDGLIPAFNVYLASTPADFYNLLAIRFIEQMEERRLGEIARLQLVHAAESCGLNTFRGIRASAEWEALIAPMVESAEDELFGIVAVSNALGWGNWHIVELDPPKKISLESANGYEAVGYRQLRGESKNPICLMLTGVAAGICELVYGEGDFEDRLGQLSSMELNCSCQDSATCCFSVTPP